ncbi:HU family DNA-binding protein [Flavobacterium luteum]|uniref:HU domain-containing protein n=1 Tax=Flavobacterium luteum TaxID=2026654 RepID=A0A7J5ACJ7_9FLAO|nr:HU family DNA-binding protein [Flavobacterium luteum]KAB1154809.1 hypothetical protein F6464_12225 [Flavobacterium luteum]
MSVSFKLVPKQNNLVSPPEIKYYPCAVSKGEADLDSLADVVSSRSSMSKADCYGVMIGLTEAIGEALADGKIVRIDALGTFKITIQGTASETQTELGKATIKGTKIVYSPSKKMKKRLENINFKRLR